MLIDFSQKEIDFLLEETLNLEDSLDYIRNSPHPDDQLEALRVATILAEIRKKLNNSISSKSSE